MVGGVIEREEPRENIQAAYIRYQNVRNECFRRGNVIKPFANLWSNYKQVEEMEADYRYTSYLNNDTLPILINFYKERVSQQDCSNLQVYQIV